jgi:NADPH:quinone reductase-like Zn-dependent oxidoreductase
MTAPKCSVSACGNVAGMELNTTVFPFILRGVSLIGIDSAESEIEFKESIWDLLAGEWKVNLEDSTKLISLNALSDEIEKILNGKQVGRIVIKHGE